MIIFLYGEDSLRRKRKFSEIVSEFIKKNGGMGFSEFDGSEETGKFMETVKSRSMFSPVTLVALKNMEFKSLSSDEKKSLSKTLSIALSDSETIALISSLESAPEKELGFLNKPPVVSQNFDLLSGEKLLFFILKEAADKGVKLSESDAKNMARSSGGDLWAISSELDKMSLAKNQPVSGKNVFIETGYFELLNALKSGGSREKKLIALELIMNELKEDPARVFNGLAYSVPRGMSPAEWFGMMADYDVAVKSGKMDYEEALLDFAIR